jgi:hypothetical protein
VVCVGFRVNALKVYIGLTRRSIEARCKKHMRHIHLEQPEKSAVVETSINIGHHTDCSSTSMLDREAGYMECLVKKAIEIRLNTRNINRDSGFILSQP